MLNRATGGLLEDWLVLGAGRAASAALQQRAVATFTGFSRLRERRADEFAVRAGSGPWLASALLKMDAAEPPPLAQLLPQWSRVLLLADVHARFRTHPLTADRIAAIPPFAFDALKMAGCPTCAATLDESGTCGQCKTQPEALACHCGATLRSDDRFCSTCGVGVPGRHLCRGCRRPSGDGHSCDFCGFPLP